MSERKSRNAVDSALNPGSKKNNNSKSNTMISNKDISFDAIASKFDKSIYGSTKGKLRHELLLFNLKDIWSLLPDNPKMLDAGGGTGEFTRELLFGSGDVTLNDISIDTLDIARKKLKVVSSGEANEQSSGQQRIGKNNIAAESGPDIHFHHGAIQSIGPDKKFDFIACHAVFEWLQEPQEVLLHLMKLLSSGGILSLSFFNEDANVFGNMLYGNFDLISNNMQQKNRLKLASHKPLKPTEVLSWLDNIDCELLQKAGIRCFHDYLKDKSQQTSHYEKLLAMEKQFCQREPYLWLGKYFHMVIRKK